MSKEMMTSTNTSSDPFPTGGAAVQRNDNLCQCGVQTSGVESYKKELHYLTLFPTDGAESKELITFANIDFDSFTVDGAVSKEMITFFRTLFKYALVI